jgi:diadenosine tetraphosphate (Ap4A) HIT family hydrolase
LPTQLSNDESAAYWRETIEFGRAVEQTQHAKLNYQMLGSNVPHVHAHIVPPGDPVLGAALRTRTAT